MPKAGLDNLRAVFREEFDDLLDVLGRQAAQVERSASPEETSATAAEVRRVVHTLKGAARAVGYGDLEAECHRLETAMEQLCAGGAPPAGEVAAAAREAIAVATRYAPLVHGIGSEPDRNAAERASPPREGQPPPGASVWAEASTSLAFAHDTVRVDAAALAQIVDASENLVQEMTRRRARATETAIESTTAELVRELEQVRRLAAALEVSSGKHGAGELRRRIERAFGSARTLATAAEARATDDVLAWTGAGARAKAVAGSARALRQDRFEGPARAAAEAARNAAEQAGVLLRVDHEGDDVRFDRRVREPLREILLHLVRNAVAHGLETPIERRAAGKPEVGVVSIAAEDGDGELRIIVRDDGRGLDLDAVAERAHALGIDGSPLEAVFAPGLTTRGSVDPLAGRGVGLDIVRQRVIDLHGRIDVETERGIGTTFRVAIAPDLSLTRALLAQAGAFAVAIRLSAIDRILRTPRDALRVASGRMHVLHDGVLLPLAGVAAELGAAAAPLPSTGALTSIVTAAGERRVALVVDELLDDREVAVRPLQGRFRSVPFVNGTTVLGDGRLTWVLDVRSLAASARGIPADQVATEAEVRRVLVVDDSATTRELERTLLRAAGFEVDAVSDGEQAWLALQGDRTFDVVLSDIEMPRLDGFSLLARIRSTPRLAQLPVVLVTALEAPSDKQRALDMGASAYVVKSAFDEERLLDVILHLL